MSNTCSPLVSVILPNYNHSLYLKARIDSILQQNYENFELIILDDCSTDNSREVIEAYMGAPHVAHIVLNESNSGSTFIQWQRGFELAQGEYIWIAESDDKAEPSFLSESMSKLLACDNGVLSFSRSYMIDQDDNHLNYSWDEPSAYCNDGVYDGKEFVARRMVYKNTVYNASMVVFRKSCLAGVDSSYKQYRYCGDWSFWFDISRQGTVVEIPLMLNYFRQHTNKVSSRSRLNGDDFREQARCQTRIADILHLSSFQRKCLRGRLTKRIRKSSIPCKEELIRQYPDLYGGGLFDIILYELSKFIV